MSAVTFAGALAFIRGAESTRDMVDCLTALATTVIPIEDLPTLEKLRKGAAGSYKGTTCGFLAIACLRDDDVYDFACRVAPKMWSRAGADTPEGKRRAHDLHADCYLALGAWVTAYNRRQIKRVA